MTDHEPMTDSGCGEPGLFQELRDALTLLRDRSDNDNFRALVDDVLAGRCSLVEASGTAAFSDVVFGSKEAPAPCATACASCSGVCAALRGYSSQ
jgi:hypothetical protein